MDNVVSALGLKLCTSMFESMVYCEREFQNMVTGVIWPRDHNAGPDPGWLVAGLNKRKIDFIKFWLWSSVAMNRVEPNLNSRLICSSGLEQNLSRLEQLPDLG
jgi:hypothetical protein